jgi:hypothetical protein
MLVTHSPLGGTLYAADDVRQVHGRHKMIHSIQIEGYRGFANFEMDGLGRINLLVGANNSGKTSVLEAILLLNSRGDPNSIWQILWRRGERFIAGEPDPRTGVHPELDVCHLFSGHEVHPGSKFQLTAKNQSPERSVSFAIAEPTPKESVELLIPRLAGQTRPQFILHVEGSPQPPMSAIPISSNGGIPIDVVQGAFRGRRAREESAPTAYISTESWTANDLIPLWEKLSLTPNEQLVLDALHFLNPDIERIASQSISQQYFGQVPRGGFKLKLKNSDQPIPIGSMGDGMWRMLAMAIAITQCKGGILLVDEIDTGLHHTVMSEMWKLIFGAAKELDVQVFATSHSFDCVHSLAKICANQKDPDNRVSLQRIETGKHKSVPYSEGEIRMASERQIEVR